MQEAKHTSGPWYSGIWDGDPDTIEIYAAEKTSVGSDKIAIAFINKEKPTVLEEVDIANAKLIAAAPDLLAFAEAYRFNLQGKGIRECDLDQCEMELLEMADAAIAKAKAA